MLICAVYEYPRNTKQIFRSPIENLYTQLIEKKLRVRSVDQRKCSKRKTRTFGQHNRTDLIERMENKLKKGDIEKNFQRDLLHRSNKTMH